MYKRQTLGRAAYHIANSNDDEERVVNRLNLVVTSTTKEELAYQLKSIVQPVSYTHLDVYKRQDIHVLTSTKAMLKVILNMTCM